MTTTIEYKAINALNKVVVGRVSEDQLHQLESMLNDQGLRLISYRLKKHTTYKTLTYFQQQILWMSLRYYMMSKFTLVESIKHMMNAVDTKLRGMLYEVHRQLEQGESFSQAINKYLPKNDVVPISLLEIAEKTGDYLEILYDLEEYSAWQVNLSQNIKQSFRYPSIIFGTLWISIFCIFYFFTPQLEGYFKEVTYTLPMLTRILIQISHFVGEWPAAWIALPFIGIGLIKILLRIYGGFSNLVVYIPGIQSFILGYYYTLIAKVLYLQLRHGYSLLQSLKIIRRIYASGWLGPILSKMILKIEKGVPFSEALKQNGRFFSKFFIQLVEVGEQSNTLCDNLKVISAYYQQDTQKKVTNAIKMIEPLMLVIMGVLLALIVGGLFYPMYQQVSLINGGL